MYCCLKEVIVELGVRNGVLDLGTKKTKICSKAR